MSADPASLSDPLATPATQLRALTASARPRLRWTNASLAVAGALLIPQAWLIAQAMQRVFVDGQSLAAVGDLLIGLLLVGLARVACVTAGRWCADSAVEDVRHALRRRLLPRLLERGPRWLRGQRSGELVEATSGHIDAFEGYVGGFLPTRFEVMVVPLLILLAVFWQDRTVGAILLFTLPLAPIFMMLVGWGAEAASRQQLRTMARLGGHFADRLRALGVLRVYGRGEAELAGIEQAAEGLRQSSLKVLRIAFLSSAVLEFFASISVAIIALYLGLSYLGMIDWRSTPLLLSTGIFCLLLAPEFYAPLRRLATHYHDRAGALAATGEIAPLLDDADVWPVTSDMKNLDRGPLHAAPGLRVEDVTLRAAPAAEPVLRDLNFAIEPGGALALVGASGSGKTTLLEALAGWLAPDSGVIDWSEPPRIGYAPQRPFLFHGSVLENLRLGAADASEADLHAAAEAAQVMRFAARLPEGLHTVIGERGFGLSGGEARRIALARLFLRQPSVLLLDEPTAFLDPATEQAVLDALLNFAQGRTLVIATHSRAVIERFPRVLSLRHYTASAAT